MQEKPDPFYIYNDIKQKKVTNLSENVSHFCMMTDCHKNVIDDFLLMDLSIV